MKYADRKKTPLKWHRILEILVLPVLIIVRGYAVLGLTSELMGFNLPFVTNYLELLLASTGVRIASLGSWFWPVAGLYIIEIGLFVWLLLIWIGLIRWRRRARIEWEIYLLLMAILSGAVVYLAYQRLVVQEKYLIILPLLASIGLIPGFLSAHLSLFIAALLLIFIIACIILVLNVIYYRKRRLLFVSHYAVPEQEKVSDESEITEKVNEESSPADGEENKSSDKETLNNEASVTENAVKTENDQPDELSEGKAAPAEEAEESSNSNPSSSEEDEKPLYCPNCGAKLTRYDQNYCTHCGTRLHE